MAGSIQAPLTSVVDVELEPIQLVAPDGTPTTETRYRRDLPPETLGWLYELMVVTRALDAEFVNLQRQGELALFASCRGQEAAQIGCGGVPAQDRLAVSAVPRDRRVPAARHHARADGRGLAGPLARRARLHRQVRRADRDSDRHPRPARGRGGDGRPAPRRGFGDGRLPRRRCDERGRRARGAQPRRPSTGRRACSSCRTTSGRSPSRPADNRPGRRSPIAPSATGCPASASTATTCWRATR